MKTASKIISLLAVACMILVCFAACGGADSTETTAAPSVDYAGSLTLDMSSQTAKVEVTVKTYVDGDTVHFNVPGNFNGPVEITSTGVLKARFLAVDTPESTGKIEEYGKAASRYTKETLSAASAIVLESDTDVWSADSTGSRFMCWVWYKPAGSDTYRNLNIELLQIGLAIASNAAQNRYGSTCMSAIAQAKAEKLAIYSGVKDPEYYYGEAVELTLKELRANIEGYNGMKVAFSGVITQNYNNSAYVEWYDAETEMYYGIPVYYGFNQSGDALEILSVGNEVRIVGKLTYYETGGIYQIVDVNYRAIKPNDPNNIQKLSDGHLPAYVATSAATFANKKVDIMVIDPATNEEVIKSFDYAALAMGTSLQMRDLVVKSVEVDNDEDSSRDALTIHCELDGVEISVRTVFVKDSNGNTLTPATFEGRSIDVKGLVDCFYGTYQIKVFTADAITIH